MRIAFTLALVILGQCLVADAWYVTLYHFNEQKAAEEARLSDLKNYAMTVHDNQYEFHFGELCPLIDEVEPLYNLIHGELLRRSDELYYRAWYLDTCDLAYEEPRVNSLFERLLPFENLKPFVFDQENMLFEMIREAIESRTLFSSQ